MSKDFEEFFDADEKRQFEGLPKRISPPGELEEKIMKRLKEEGLVNSDEKQNKWGVFRLAVASAVAVLILILGVAVGSYWQTVPADLANDQTPQFLLLLRSDSQGGEKLSKEEVGERVKEYTAWASQINEKGQLINAEKLKSKTGVLDETKKIKSAANQTDSLVVGFYLVKADSYEQAVSIAKDCPHLKYGGEVEVREIDKFR